MRIHPRNAALVAALALLAGACGGPNPVDPPTTGSLTVIVETRGNLPDPDGYRLTRSGGEPVAVAANGSVRMDSLAPGSYTLTLDGSSLYCVVEGGSTQTGRVVAGESVTATFRVRCERNGLAYLTVAGSVTSLHVAFPGRDHVTLATGIGSARVRFSPDGRQILYAASPAAGTPQAIMSVDLDSLRVAQITPPGAPGRSHPAWSPDGTRVAYVTSAFQLRTLRVGETAETTVWQAPAGEPVAASMPVWSPDGTRIAFLRVDDAARIAIIDADGGGERTLITLNTLPYLQIDWSPDGGSVVAADQRTGGRGIYRIDVASGQATPVATSATLAFRNPTYLRDGRIGFYAQAADGTPAGSWIVNADGSGLTQVTVPGSTGGASIIAWQ